MVWAATYDGLARYDRRANRSQIFTHNSADPDSLADNYARDLIKTADGRLFVTTRLGLDIFDPARGSFRHIRHDPSDPRSIASDNLQPILQDAEGHIWIGAVGDGLAVLWNWDKNGQPRFRKLDRQDGFPGGIVLTLAQAKDGRIWANTSSGLAAIDPRTLEFHTFLAADGLRTTAQNLFSSVVLDDGTVLFPGSGGVIAILPGVLEPWTYRAPLSLTEVRAGDSRNPAGLAQTAQVGGLTLHPSSRGFEAEFALLDFTGPEKRALFL